MANGKCEDHLGNKYDSKSAMCNHWGIPTGVFRWRIQNGWTLEKALTTPVNNCSTQTSTDHLGKTFKSTQEMCKYWGVPADRFRLRIYNGWALEKALTTPVRGMTTIKTDHLGNTFKSNKEMCDHWGISIDVFRWRVHNGWTLEKALTTPVKETSYVEDHLGNKFKTLKNMCEHWGVTSAVYTYRITLGWSIKEALETPITCTDIEDHLGNKFKSTDEMCKHWGVYSSLFRDRIKRGLSLKEALETPIGWTRSIKGPNGEAFKSFTDMCEHYGHHPSAVRHWMKNGDTLEEALTKKCINGLESTDHKGNVFKSQRDMCRHYGISESCFVSRKRLGWTLEEILTTPVKDTQKAHTVDILGKHYISIADAISKINKTLKHYTVRSRLEAGADLLAALTCTDKMQLMHIGLNGHAYYRISNHRELMTTREIVAKFRPDLLPSYDAWNPKDLYILNRGGLDG